MGKHTTMVEGQRGCVRKWHGASLFRPGCTPLLSPHLAVWRGQSGCEKAKLRKRSAKSYQNPPPSLQLGGLTKTTKKRRQANNTKSSSIMFGPFRVTNSLSGGLLWKIPWRLSRFQKRRHRLRLRAVDSVVATLDAALAKKGQTLEAIERLKAEMPVEQEMLPRDKYTMFDRKEKKYRKGIHSMFAGEGCWYVFGFGGFGADDENCRIAKVDESFAESQSSRILIWDRCGNEYIQTERIAITPGERGLGKTGDEPYKQRLIVQHKPCNTAQYSGDLAVWELTGGANIAAMEIACMNTRMAG